MKRNEFKKNKTDFVFIAVITVVLIGLFVGSLFLNSKDSTIGIEDLPDEFTFSTNKLIISEVVSSNKGIYSNENNQVVDYIELYNGTGKTIDLTGYGLSDRDDRVKWLFPSVSIEPNQYLVVALTGQSEDGLNANFKLSSSGGERIILVNSSYKVVDAVDTVALSKNQSMNRKNDGSWYISDYGTPGFENSKSGLEEYLISIQDFSDNDLVINEVLVKNEGNFLNEDGLLAGYIEIKNISDHSVNLSEYSISSDIYLPFRYQLADYVLQSGEIYLIYTGENNYSQSTISYCGFNLNSKNGSVVLSHNGKIVDQLDYTNLANGLALIRTESGQINSSNTLSGGFDNNSNGVDLFQQKYRTIKEGLVINEVMNDNYSYLAQNGGRYYDWIELYNNSSQAINLADYCLSTSKDNLSAYQLPDVTLQAYQYYIVMASGSTGLSNNSYQHTDFKLSDCEGLYLSKANQIVDCLYMYDIPTDYSYGRNSDYGFYYISSPTPKAQNKAGLAAISIAPSLENQQTIFNNTSSVTVSFKDSGTIYYTTDGSVPTQNSNKYTGPFTISDTTVISARTINANEVPSDNQVYSFILNENDGLPIVSIVMDEDDFETMDYYSYDTELEFPCNIQYYVDGQLQFSQPCSITCFGGNARSQYKKSYGLRFKGSFGENNLEYQMFENRDNAVFDSLVLRTGSNDWVKTIFRDILCTSLMDDYLDCQSYQACVAYINGEYWGIYNIREKVNDSFIADHYNVSKESVSIVNVDFSQKCGEENIASLFYWAETHDLSNDENYQYLCSKIDVVNFADFWISQMYCVNPDVYNIRYFCSSELDDGKWKYIYYDMDHGFRFPDINYYTTYLCNPYGMTGWINNTYSNALPRKLFENQQFVDLWLERLSYHLHNNLSKENVTKQLDYLIDLYSEDIAKDRQRWADYPDVLNGLYPSMSRYNSEIGVIRDFIEQRQSYVLQQTKDYFGLSDAQMKEIFTDLW
ncbi:MAG: lamin tail domain-containing protein [Erysipelotrichaceae bacterium]